jgi:hypothetical protein
MELLEQDSHNETARPGQRSGQQGQGKQNRIASIGLSELLGQDGRKQDCQNKAARTGLQCRTART